MLKLDPSRQAHKFLKHLQASNPKHARQFVHKIQALRDDPQPPGSTLLKGKAAAYRRADIGEYRIVYRVEADTLKLALIGKRNDADIYRQLERKL
jgi:mRNA interferase RelE/StbE